MSLGKKPAKMGNQDLRRESPAGPSREELAVATSPKPAEALLLRRAQDAQVGEMRRVLNLLIRREDRRLKPQRELGRPHDVTENKDSYAFMDKLTARQVADEPVGDGGWRNHTDPRSRTALGPGAFRRRRQWPQ